MRQSTTDRLERGIRTRHRPAASASRIGAIAESVAEEVVAVEFDDHSARHENGGADEISVAGLSGVLADAQNPTAHTHEVNEINDLRFGAISIADGGTIAHGCGTVPAGALLTASVSGEFASLIGTDATNLTVAIKKHDNSAGTTQTIYYLAWI